MSALKVNPQETPLPDGYLEVCILEIDGGKIVSCIDGQPQPGTRQQSAPQGAKTLIDPPKVQDRMKTPILGDQEIVGEKPSLAIPILHLPFGFLLQKGGKFWLQYLYMMRAVHSGESCLPCYRRPVKKL